MTVEIFTSPPFTPPPPGGVLPQHFFTCGWGRRCKRRLFKLNAGNMETWRLFWNVDWRILKERNQDTVSLHSLGRSCCLPDGVSQLLWLSEYLTSPKKCLLQRFCPCSILYGGYLGQKIEVFSSLVSGSKGTLLIPTEDVTLSPWEPDDVLKGTLHTFVNRSWLSTSCMWKGE